MGEREFNLIKTPERSSEQTSLLFERLVLQYNGRLHFQEAVDMAATVRSSDVRNALVEVGENMAEVGVAPDSVLQRLTSIRDGIPPDNDPKSKNMRDRAYMESGIADMYAVLGRNDEAKALLPPPEKDESLWAAINVYVSAGVASIRRGENPTPLLEEAMDRIDRHKSPWDNHAYLEKHFTLYV